LISLEQGIEVVENQVVQFFAKGKGKQTLDETGALADLK
jgi:hypothetical protein